MKKSVLPLFTLILSCFSLSPEAYSSGFGGVSAALGIKVEGDESANLAQLSAVSYVDGSPTGSTNWGQINASIVQEGEGFLERFDTLALTVVSGWKYYGSGRTELVYQAGKASLDQGFNLLDIYYGQSGVSLPLYGDWVRLALLADLRTRRNFADEATTSTSLGLPISLSFTTPIDRPLIFSGNADIRAGFQLFGGESESISVDAYTSVSAGYSVVQESSMNVHVYIKHALKSFYLGRDENLSRQMFTLGVDLSL